MKTVVLGGGPGGYVCAIRLAQLGAKVTLIERGSLGGTCLNVGCIPTKALLHTAEVFRSAQKAAEFGVRTAAPAPDWPTAQQYKQQTVDRLVGGVAGLLKANGVELVAGSGRFLNKTQLEVALSGGGRRVLDFERAVIATGSRPRALALEGAGLPGVIDSTGALSLERLPASMVVVGGGVIGCEMVDLFASLGCAVTVLEALPDILAGFDLDIVTAYKKTLRARRVKLEPGAAATRITQSNGGLTVEYSVGKAAKTAAAEVVLLAAGRSPNTENIGLGALGLGTERGFIPVESSSFETKAPGIYAIGDVIDTPMLAHTASAEGTAAAQAIMGVRPREQTRFDIVPSCVYTALELAGVGLTQQQCEQRGVAFETGSFPISANGRSMIAAQRLGVVKLIADPTSKKLLGAHLACGGATELIAGLALALRMGATLYDIESTIFAHPTVSECVHEAALGALGRALHIPPRA